MTNETHEHRPDGHEDNAFARWCPFGKLDDKMDEVRMDSATMERARSIACEMGMGMADYLRMLVRVGVWGEEHVASVTLSQIKRVSGRGGSVSGSRGTDQ